MILKDPQTDKYINCERTAYSLANLTRSVLEAPAGRRQSPDGLEGRVSDALRSGLRPSSDRVGVLAPFEMMGPRTRGLDLATRSVLTTPLTAAPLDFTDVLRSKSAAGLLGVRFASLSGQEQLVSIPTKASAASAAWIADGDPAPKAAPTFVADPGGQTKTLAVAVEVERKVWNSTDDAFHDYLVADVAAGFAAEMDRAVVVGAGGLEPTGVLNLDGVPAMEFGANGGPPKREALVAAMRAVHDANGDAPATAAMGWLTSPDGEAALRLADGSTGDSGAWLWSDSDRVLGKRAVSTTNVPADLTKGTGTDLTALVYGNWGDVLVNHSPWVQIIVRERKCQDGPVISILAFLDVRILFRHKASFMVFKDMKTS